MNIIILTLFFISSVNSSNILGLFPHPGYSHFKVFYPILKGLADRGHNLTIVTYIKSKNLHSNYREIILTGGEDSTHVFEFKDFIPGRSLLDMFIEFWDLHIEGKEACELFYKSGALDDIRENHAKNPFDLVIMENFNNDCMMGIPYILNAPIIGLSSCAFMPWHYERVAIPDYPSYIPTEFVAFSDRMSFSERFQNFIVTKGSSLLYRLFTEVADNKIVKEKLNIDINVRDVAKRTSLILINQHYSLSGSRPLPNRVIEIGGVHIQNNSNEIIPEDIQEFLDSSKNGVIFISWGSMIKASSLDVDKVSAITRALKTLQENILWKWEDDKLPTKDKKFKFIKWAPQKEILCHPKVKIFWSHGGLLGVTESVYCAKPLVVTPIYGDQFLNAAAIERRGIGIILLHENLHEETILKAFKEIYKSDYSYRANDVSNVFRNRENSPLDTALWWIEHVLHTKGNNLSYSAAVELNGFVYYSLDVISVLFGCFLASLFLVFQTLRWCCRCRNKATQKTKKQKRKKLS